MTRELWRGAATLGAVVLASVILLGVLQLATRDRVAEAERASAQRALAVLLPIGSFDNNPNEDAVWVTAPHYLGSEQPMRVKRARRESALSALLIETVAPDGYSGDIRLLIGVSATGKVLGIRVLAHRETPGLGDAFEPSRSDWLARLRGLALGAPPLSGWRVKRDAGQFDQFAGATITPRAVLGAVRRSLQLAQAHGESLAAAPSGSELRFAEAPQDP